MYASVCGIATVTMLKHAFDADRKVSRKLQMHKFEESLKC